jgi:hypothetical protein
MDPGKESPPSATTSKIRLARPYAIYNVSSGKVLLDLVPGQKVPEVPRGLLYMPSRWIPIAASDIKTVILLNVKPLESVGYAPPYHPHAEVTVQRWRYFMWAFDSSNDTLGASTRLDDPDSVEEFADTPDGRSSLHLNYFNLCQWADSVTVGAPDDWCIHPK